MNSPRSTTVRLNQEIGSLRVDFDGRILIDSLLIGLVKLLEDVAGTEDASTFIGSVAGQIGSALQKKYSSALGSRNLSRERLSSVLVDLENRAGGHFFIMEDSADRIVLGNSKCPLGKISRGHPSLCLMTSNIVGRLTANTVGYAAVDITKAIARGHRGCRVVINLKSMELLADTREYFRDDALPL